MITPATDRLIDLALEEDIALGDLTSESIFSQDHRCSAYLQAKQDLVICGIEVAKRVLQKVDADARFLPAVHDGDRCRPGQELARIEGGTRAVLRAERTLLNFLQRLSGVATQSARYAAAVAGTGVRIVDTRKTTPGWRALEKAAVRCGGCHNHRSSLGEHVLIKDNHIAAAGGLSAAIQRCRLRAPHLARIECEITSIDQVEEALAAGAEVLLLDNMTPDGVAAAVAKIAGRARTEVSGGVTLESLPGFAAARPDVISIGALTHGAKAVDISLEVVPAP